MSDKKGHERMQELTDSLSSAMGRLQEGKLGPEELEQATTDARLLFERLVVLRHKLREAAVGHNTKSPVQSDVAPVAEPTMSPMRLDTRPPEAPAHQTSLIDAIAETESIPVPVKKPVMPKAEKPVMPKAAPAEKPVEPGAEKAAVTAIAEPAPKPEDTKTKEPEVAPVPAGMPKSAPMEIAEPKAEKPKAAPMPVAEQKTARMEFDEPKTEKPKDAPMPVAAPKPPRPRTVLPAEERPITVADKMEHAPVADLRKVIALSQKFWFVAELFSGERDRYEKTIDALNAMESFGPANAYLESEVLSKLPKQPGEVADTFRELLKRRYRA
ncbi:MAG: hypothetical protein IPN44_13185 [Flavobacteriales bacterium]|nr:hypothetical protein [Flavobacteriales bacterium]